jgi:hypothetical protein
MLFVNVTVSVSTQGGIFVVPPASCAVTQKLFSQLDWGQSEYERSRLPYAFSEPAHAVVRQGKVSLDGFVFYVAEHKRA